MSCVIATLIGEGKRRAHLDAELQRVLVEFPRLGVTKAILFGSLASGVVGRKSRSEVTLIGRASCPCVAG